MAGDFYLIPPTVSKNSHHFQLILTELAEEILTHTLHVFLRSDLEALCVHLAKTLTEGANVILLDEPTNDLDVNTLRALEEALEDFAGTALVVSHDRWFLDCICTHLIVFEGDSVAKMYLGNWSGYETMMREKFGKDLLRIV